MSQILIEDKEFNGIDFSQDGLPKGDYEACSFTNCIFSNSDLSHFSFIECEFVSCDLSMAKLVNTAFREVKFKDCKLLGLHFENCNEFLFEVCFESCQLNLSSFYQRNLKNTLFKACSLHEADFAEADLTNSRFTDCDLSGAAFDRTGLEKCDFRSASNFSIDPENNRIKKAKFSVNGLEGLLYKYKIVVE